MHAFKYFDIGFTGNIQYTERLKNVKHYKFVHDVTVLYISYHFKR
jgi:hypothetical protein